jgi:hypothetical protein
MRGAAFFRSFKKAAIFSFDPELPMFCFFCITLESVIMTPLGSRKPRQDLEPCPALLPARLLRRDTRERQMAMAFLPVWQMGEGQSSKVASKKRAFMEAEWSITLWR